MTGHPAIKGGQDTTYLKEMVGEALARGCAAVVTAQPNDPVEYMGLWLLRYVKSAEVEGNFFKERQQQLQERKERLESEINAAAEARRVVAERTAAINKLAGLRGLEPATLLQAAADVIRRYVPAASGAYAALVADPEDPDWTPPEDDEEAGKETDDEAAESAPREEGEGGEEDADADAAEPDDSAAAEGEVGEDGEPLPPKPKRPVDYSKKYFAYVAATACQEFVKEVDLRRPAPLGDDVDPDDPDAPKAEPLPVTFRILDEVMPLLYVPSVSSEPRVKFFKRFPKIGSYLAVGIQPASHREFRAMVAADSLFPEAGGQAFSDEDKDFMWEACVAVGKAFDALEQQVAAKRGEEDLGDVVSELEGQLKDIRAQKAEGDEGPSTAVEGEEGEEGEGAEGGEEGEEAEEEAEPEEEEAAEEEEEEVEEDEDGNPIPKPKKPKDPIPALRRAVDKAEKAVEKAEAVVAKAEAAEARAAFYLDVHKQALQTCVEALQRVSEPAVYGMRHTLRVPQCTYHVLKALLLLLGRAPGDMATWQRALAHVTPALFEQAAAYDATQERDLALWARIRCCYKAVSSRKALLKEAPDHHAGPLALHYLKQVRRVALKAALHRQAVKALEAAKAKHADKVAAVEAANKAVEAAIIAKEEAEAAAAAEAERLAAEKEAAAAAKAAAAAESGEGEGAGEEGEEAEGQEGAEDEEGGS